jgi:hypothetical protein
MQNAGLPVVGAIKGKDSIFAGITRVQELLGSAKLRIMRGKAANLLDEFSMYSYKEAKGDGSISDQIMDTYNHSCDALRYLVAYVWDQFKSSVPSFKPSKTHLQRLIAGEFSVKQGVQDEW